MIIGIDLGTTNSAVGIWREGKAELIPNSLGHVLTPSAVSLDDQGAGAYQVNWKTPKSYAKSCKTLELDLGDGVARTAAFRFTK